MILFAFFYNPQGDHRMAWRHPQAPGREVFGLALSRGRAGWNMPIVAGPVEEAMERQARLAELMPDRVAIDLLSSWAGVDLSAYPPDGPVPDLPDPGTFEGWKTWLALVRAEANQGLSIRDLARRIANTGAVPLLAGTPQSIADELEAWVASGAANGFNLMFPLLPDDWMALMREVVPELQRQGLVRRNYGPGSLLINRYQSVRKATVKQCHLAAPYLLFAGRRSASRVAGVAWMNDV